MKKIILNSIHIENFRGIKALDVTCGDNVSVSGRNGSGKTSVYNAYLWCLFNKDAYGKSIEVRPIDLEHSAGSNVQYLHNIDTKVVLTFSASDGTSFSVARVEREDWSVPRGMSTPIYKGQTQERLINDVPYGVREFATKLNSFCDADNWFMLSSINAFMSLGDKARRAVLESISGGIDEQEIAKDFPHVLLAMQQGKNVLELKRQTKLTKDTSKRDLDSIPARIDQQEKLRVDIDVDKYTGIKEHSEQMKAEYEKSLEEHLSTRPGTESNVLSERLATINASIAKLTNSVSKKQMELSDAVLKEYHNAQAECGRLNCAESTANMYLERTKAELKKSEADLQAAIANWQNVNAMEYVEGEIETVCPTCHRELDPFQIQEIKNKAVEDFNKKKSDMLASAINSGSAARAARDKASADVAKYTEDLNKAKAEYDIAFAKCSELKAKLDAVRSVSDILSEDSEYNMLLSEKSDIEKKMLEQASGQKDAMVEFNNRTQELQTLIKLEDATIRDAVNQLAAVQTNGRIDQERARLEKMQEDLAQTIADCDLIDMEISAYVKRKITIAESNVSKFFDIVSWQLYERNISNDGEKEICEAIIDGRPYATQNTATKVNAGIDIINGISKALDINVPMFVDNKESVTELISTDSQLFTFSVVEGQELTIQ